MSGGLGPENERSWNMYTSSNPNPPQLALATPHRDLNSSTSAISFGFAATAILISMFMIMAIFEHLFRPSQPDHILPRSSSSSESAMQKHCITSEPNSMTGFSVVMPGHQRPTHIAKPAPWPLQIPPPPCSREGINWPQHSP